MTITAFLVAVLLGYWPLPSNHGVTGTFTEFRNNHLHAGVDLSTAGQVGLPVQCFADGTVFRIKVQKRGYGKVMYVRHPGLNRISVYGHLDRFMPELEQIVQRFRETRKTRYPGDMFLEDPVWVRKGQVIAYSGETGAGWAHLHFELRDLANRPIDPVSEGFDMDHDRTPPRFHSLNIYPETAGSRINGSIQAASIPVLQQGPSTFTIPEPVLTAGPFLSSIALTDRDGKKGPLGIRSLSLFVDNEQVYRFHADRFTYDNWWQTAAVYDLATTRLSPSRYAYNLFRISGAELAVQEKGKWSLEPGHHSIRVQAVDFNNNPSELRFDWVQVPPEAPAATTLLTGVQYSNGSTVIDAAAITEQRTLTFGETPWEVVRIGPSATHCRLGNVHIQWMGFSDQWRLGHARNVQPQHVPKGLVSISGTFIHTGPGLSFLRSIRLTYDPGQRTVSDKEHWYRFDKAKKKWFVLRRLDPSSRQMLVSSHYRTGRFGVFRDEARPIVHDGPRYFRKMTVWKLTDVGSGIDDERITLRGPKGTVFQMAYDPDRKLAFVQKKLIPGSYVVRVFDRAGNEGSARSRLR